jgi:hypothetical protein
MTGQSTTRATSYPSTLTDAQRALIEPDDRRQKE